MTDNDSKINETQEALVSEAVTNGLNACHTCT